MTRPMKRQLNLFLTHFVRTRKQVIVGGSERFIKFVLATLFFSENQVIRQGEFLELERLLERLNRFARIMENRGG